MNGGPCTHEDELLPIKAKILAMKGNTAEFWQKPAGGAVEKRLQNHEWGELVAMKANFWP